MENKQVIVYVNEGEPHVVMPAPECGLTVEQIAQKDVPTGLPYKIVDISELPTDLNEIGTWVVDETVLTDGVGA